MALEGETGQTRTEAPTPRRREEARAEGNVAFSAELTSGLMLLCGVAALALLGPVLAYGLLQCVRSEFLGASVMHLDAGSAEGMMAGAVGTGLGIIGAFLAVMILAALLIPVLQVGLHLTPGLLRLNLERLAPTRGWGRLVARENLLKGVVAIFKVCAVGGVAWWALRGRLAGIAGLSDMPLTTASALGWALVIRVALAAAGALVVLGVADYALQRWRFEQSLRMTRQELKDELKSEEGDPQVKARIRKLQRDVAQKRMMQDVPKASVVITNPTHLAVALRYEAGAMAAPRVVAKGAGFVALRIADLARQHGVPVLERKPLAQALFKAAQVGQEIPTPLYVAVAEVLAHVYRMRGMVDPRAAASTND